MTQNVAEPKAIQTAAFSEAMLVRGMAGIRAKNGMVFLDTCHAGAFSLDSASQLAHESGRYVLAGASSVEEALDSYDNKNGVFATAVLRGLRGAGARPGETVVNNFELGFFVRPQVKQLAEEKNHRQTAQFGFLDANGFPFDPFGGYRDPANRVRSADGTPVRGRDRRSRVQEPGPGPAS